MIAIIAHLAQYSPALLARLSNFEHGIQTQSKFPPSIADIAEFCRGLTFDTERPAHHKVLNGREPEPWAIAALNAVATISADRTVAWAEVLAAFASEGEAVRQFLAAIDVPEHAKAIGITFARLGPAAAFEVIRAGMAYRLAARLQVEDELGRQPQGRVQAVPDMRRGSWCFEPRPINFDISDLPNRDDPNAAQNFKSAGEVAAEVLQ